MSDETRVARAKARASWTVRVYRLGEEPSEDLSETTTVLERLAMMWPLAVAAHTLGGAALPDYQRQAAPGKIWRGRRPHGT